MVEKTHGNIVFEGGGGSCTSLCCIVSEYNIKFSKDFLEKIGSALVGKLASEGYFDDALKVIDLLESKGISSPDLTNLKFKIIEMEKINNDYSSLVKTMKEALDAFNNGDAGTLASILQTLKQEIDKTINDLREASEYGVTVNTSLVNYARDVYNILSIAEDLLNVNTQLKSDFQQLTSMLQQLSGASNLVDFGGRLASLGAFLAGLKPLIDELDSISNKISQLQFYTDNGMTLASKVQDMISKIRDSLLRLYSMGLALEDAGSSLADLMQRMPDAYDPANAKHFFWGKEGEEKQVVNDMVSVLSAVNLLRGIGGDDEIAKLAHGLADTLYNIMKELKMTTVYEDYRWNKLWEQAEAASGVDLGTITVRDYYMYTYDPETGQLEERPGISGWLERHFAEITPEDILEFFAGVEDFVRKVQDANDYLMRHANNRLEKLLGEIGYLGSSALAVYTSILMPKLLIDGLAQFFGTIANGLYDLITGNLDAAKQEGKKLWDMFFGSKEAILGLIGSMMAVTAIAGASEMIPKEIRAKIVERAPFAKDLGELMKKLFVGDVIGAGLQIIAKGLELAGLEDTVAGMIKSGEEAVSTAIREAIAEYAEKGSRIARELASHILDVLKNMKGKYGSLGDLASQIKNAVEEYGVAFLKDMTKDYVKIASKLEELARELKTKSMESAVRKLLLETYAAKSLDDLVGKITDRISWDNIVDVLREKGLLPEDLGYVIDHLKEIEEQARERGDTKLVDAIERLKKATLTLAEKYSLLEEIEKLYNEFKEKYGGGGEKVTIPEIDLEALNKLKELGISVSPDEISGFLAKIGSRLKDIADRIGDKVDEILASEETSDLKKKFYRAGLVVSDLLGTIAEWLMEHGLKDDAYKLVEEVADELEKRALEYADRADILLKELRDAVREFEKSGKGKLYSAMLGTFESTIEKILSSGDFTEAVKKALSEDADKLVNGIDSALDNLELKLARKLSSVTDKVAPDLRTTLSRVIEEALDKGEKLTPDDLELLKEIIGDEADAKTIFDIVNEYADLVEAKNVLEAVLDKLESGKDLTLDEAHEIVDRLAEINKMLGGKAEKAIVEKILSELGNEEKGSVLSKDLVVKLENLAGAKAVFDMLEQLSGKLREIGREDLATKLDETAAKLRDALREGDENAVESALKDLEGVLKKITKIDLLDRIKSRLESIADFFRKFGVKSSVLEDALKKLRDVVEETIEEEKNRGGGGGKNWFMLREAIKAYEGDLAVPPDVYDRVIDLINEPEKRFRALVDGKEVEVVRRVKFMKDGVEVEYDIDVDGRKIKLKHSSVYDKKTGRVYEYDYEWIDPELQRELGVELERAGLSADEFMRDLEKKIFEMDPNASVLDKFVVLLDGKAYDLFRKSLQATMAGLFAAVATAINNALRNQGGGGGKGGGSTTVPIPREELLERLAKLIEDLLNNKLTIEDRVLLSLDKSARNALKEIYENLKSASKELEEAAEKAGLGEVEKAVKASKLHDYTITTPDGATLPLDKTVFITIPNPWNYIFNPPRTAVIEYNGEKYWLPLITCPECDLFKFFIILPTIFTDIIDYIREHYNKTPTPPPTPTPPNPPNPPTPPPKERENGGGQGQQENGGGNQTPQPIPPTPPTPPTPTPQPPVPIGPWPIPKRPQPKPIEYNGGEQQEQEEQQGQQEQQQENGGGNQTPQPIPPTPPTPPTPTPPPAGGATPPPILPPIVGILQLFSQKTPESMYRSRELLNL